jgi:hypothetical protein
MILTIDPGLTGAACAFASLRSPEFRRMPVRRDGSRSMIDLPQLAAWVRGCDVTHAVLERQTPMHGQGLASTGSIMRQYGALEGLLTGLGIPWTPVDPKAWRRSAGILPSSAKNKNAALDVMAREAPYLCDLVAGLPVPVRQACGDCWCMGLHAIRSRICDSWID